MSTKDEAGSLATETISEMTKQMILVDNRVNSIYRDICKIKSLFRAVHYAAVEGGISGSETDEAMSGIRDMFNALEDNASETAGISDKFVMEVMGV